MTPADSAAGALSCRAWWSAETAEVARALHAQKICEAEHGPAHQVFDGEVN